MRAALFLNADQQQLLAEARTAFGNEYFDSFYLLAEVDRLLSEAVSGFELMSLFARASGSGTAEFSMGLRLSKLLKHLLPQLVVTRVFAGKVIARNAPLALQEHSFREPVLAEVLDSFRYGDEIAKEGRAAEFDGLIHQMAQDLRVCWKETPDRIEPLFESLLQIMKRQEGWPDNGCRFVEELLRFVEELLAICLERYPELDYLFAPVRSFTETPEGQALLVVSALIVWILLYDLSDEQVAMGVIEDEALEEALESERTILKFESAKIAASNLALFCSNGFFHLLQLHHFAFTIGHPEEATAAAAVRKAFSVDPAVAKTQQQILSSFSELCAFLEIMSALSETS